MKITETVLHMLNFRLTVGKKSIDWFLCGRNTQNACVVIYVIVIYVMRHLCHASSMSCVVIYVNLVPRVFSLFNMAAAREKTLAHSDLKRSLIGAILT